MVKPDEKGLYHVDEAYAWLDEGTGVIMLKAVAGQHGDPLELNADQARELAEVLLELAEKSE